MLSLEKMDSSSQRKAGGGQLWNTPRTPTYSKETHDMLLLMMQETKLSNLQRKQIIQCLKNGERLPLTGGLPTAAVNLPQKPRKSVPTQLPGRPQKRSLDSCRSGNSYIREKFRPGPTRDLEKEKTRLQNIMATGQEEPVATMAACQKRAGIEEVDRYQEVLDEIEERRQFLKDMASLGQEKPYLHIINTEISQKIRELKMLDKDRIPKMSLEASERRAEPMDLQDRGPEGTDCC